MTQGARRAEYFRKSEVLNFEVMARRRADAEARDQYGPMIDAMSDDELGEWLAAIHLPGILRLGRERVLPMALPLLAAEFRRRGMLPLQGAHQ